MASTKLQKILSIINRRFQEEQTPFAVIGAMALGAYGLPRFTADIDLLAKDENRSAVTKILTEMGLNCVQETAAFARFDSEMGVYGTADIMYVTSSDGEEILERRISVTDELMGDYPVIQPDDYIVLKLMAIANDPTRQARDEGDIAALLKHIRQKSLPDVFEPIQRDRILRFARRFGLERRMHQMFREYLDTTSSAGSFFL